MNASRRQIFGMAFLGALLLGCATPEQTCLRAAQAELAALDRDIADAERAIARGYRVSETVAPVTTLHICAWPRESVLFCTRHTPGADARRVPVNIAAEQARLDSLRSQRSDVLTRTQAAVAACRIG